MAKTGNKLIAIEEVSARFERTLKRIKGTGILVICIFILPIVIFLLKFHNLEISNNPQDWAIFGDYIGGVVGTALSLVAVIISFISIILSIQTSGALHVSELRHAENLTDKQINHSIKMAEMENMMVINQSRPFLYFDLSMIPGDTRIDICNYGNGPMVVKEIKIKHNPSKGIFRNFDELLTKVLTNYSRTGFDIHVDTAQSHVIPAKGSKYLLKVEPKQKQDKRYSTELSALMDVLRDSGICLKFEDIFGNEFYEEQELSSFGNS